jgi:hypothetical protein
MIQMCMSENNGVQGSGIELKGKAISRSQLRLTLNQTAIDEDALGIALKEQTRTGHGLCRTEELDAEHADHRTQKRCPPFGILPALTKAPS